MNITLIGDAHGKWRQLNKMVRNIPDSPLILQVGDLGLGFNKKRDPKRRFVSNFKFIRGNHDDPAICAQNPSYLGDYGYLEEFHLGYISGANSVDKYKRCESIDWWPDEQLTYVEMQAAIDCIIKNRPSIIVTHDCPQGFYNYMTDGNYSRFGETANFTATAYQHLFEAYQPKLWVFGHHHKPKNFQSNGTHFFCLPELQTLNVTLPL